MRAAIVVPTIREACIRDFLEAWGAQFADQTVIVVEDNPERTFDIAGGNVRHYAHADIDADLGSEAWIIPRKTDCVRSYGIFKAWQEKPDLIITLDDDCFPHTPFTFVAEHWAHLSEPGRSQAWVSTLHGATPRGLPYFETARERICALNHGLWEVVPDFDAPSQLVHGRYPPRNVAWVDQVVPVGSYFPMCSMNVAVLPRAVPALYFLLMGLGTYPYDRFGDIWCGVIFKKIADHLGYCVKSGSPSVRHQRASNVWVNLRKEVPGLEVNETFWRHVDAIPLRGASFKECYREIADGLPMLGDYWDKLRYAMTAWTQLFGG